METLQASILSAIKTIRSSKKQAYKPTVYKFIKRELQSITNEEKTDTLKTLREMRLVQNKPLNDKSFYFVTYYSCIADSQPHIPITMATPIIEKSASSEILSPSVEDEIDSFVTSDVENNNNDSSETLDLIDSAYKNIKYKKIKDILLRDIKNDVAEFIENEIKQKLDLHNKEEYKILVDKRIIATLEKEIEFLKTEICSENEIINKFLNNNTQKNNNDNMEGEIWDFGDTCNTSDSHSVSSTVKSRDSLA